MSTKPLTVVVTGANRGIGLAIVQSLAKSPPITPLCVLACARQPPADPPVSSTSSTEVVWHSLDIANSNSVSSLASKIKKSRSDGVDVLINNAGVNLDEANPPGLDISTRTLDVNYRGTMAVTKALLPLMQSSAANESLGKRRVVTVSSVGSKNPSSERRRQLAACSSLDEIEKFGDEYLRSVSDGTVKEDGWTVGQSYSVSKAMLNAATKLLAEENSGLLINACCPGWCNTDTGKLTGDPPKTAAEGARVPLNLAFEDLEGVSGKYWENDSPFSKGAGRPTDWTK